MAAAPASSGGCSEGVDNNSEGVGGSPSPRGAEAGKCSTPRQSSPPTFRRDTNSRRGSRKGKVAYRRISPLFELAPKENQRATKSRGSHLARTK